VCLHRVARDPSLRADIATGMCLFRPLISFADDVPENTRSFQNFLRWTGCASPKSSVRRHANLTAHPPCRVTPSARLPSQLSFRWQRRTTTYARSSLNYPPFARSAPCGPVHSPVGRRLRAENVTRAALECVSQRCDGTRVMLTFFYLLAHFAISV
jgi:hypothetical protein